MEPWQIDAMRWFIERAESGFLQVDFTEYMKKTHPKLSPRFISMFFNETITQPVGRSYGRTSDSDGRWYPPIELVAIVIEYDELVEARQNAKRAFYISILALGAAVIVPLISACIT